MIISRLLPHPPIGQNENSFSYALLVCYLSFVHHHHFSHAFTIPSYPQRLTLISCVRRFLLPALEPINPYPSAAKQQNPIRVIRNEVAKFNSYDSCNS